MPLVLIAAVALAAVLVPLVQKREYAIALNKQAEEARVQALAADAVRTQLERAQGEYNFVLAKKYAYPGTVQLLDGVTRVLPDDTWVTQLEMRTSLRGKDTQRDLVLRGESANAGKLIGLLEDSKLVEQAALRSSTTKIQPGPGRDVRSRARRSRSCLRRRPCRCRRYPMPPPAAPLRPVPATRRRPPPRRRPSPTPPPGVASGGTAPSRRRPRRRVRAAPQATPSSARPPTPPGRAGTRRLPARRRRRRPAKTRNPSDGDARAADLAALEPRTRACCC